MNPLVALGALAVGVVMAIAEKEESKTVICGGSIIPHKHKWKYSKFSHFGYGTNTKKVCTICGKTHYFNSKRNR